MIFKVKYLERIVQKIGVKIIDQTIIGQPLLTLLYKQNLYTIVVCTMCLLRYNSNGGIITHYEIPIIISKNK